MRGYAAVALNNPKSAENVGGAMRAIGVFQASLLIIAGERFKTLKKFPTDTMKIWKHIPILETDDIFNSVPYECVPVAVEMMEGAKPLPKYWHPERALYIFGAENETLDEKILDKCRDKIMIPTKRCLNLASCVNVILYDRLAKKST